jgi:5-methylcytosine-specific restriction protein A
VRAVILGWDAGRTDLWDYRAAVERVAMSGRTLQRWPVGPDWCARPESEVWLVLHGASHAAAGLAGHGAVLTEPFEALPDNAGAHHGRCVTVAFDALLPLGEQIRFADLYDAVPGVRWDAARGGADTALPRPAESALRRLWQEQGPAPSSLRLPVPGTCPPEAAVSVVANRYEQDPDARRRCLAFHGTSCAACGFSFEEAFGQAGAEAMDVHHIVPPALLGSGYQPDPVADLVPLCPNCHAMAHNGRGAPHPVSELRGMLSAAGHLQGQVVGRQALNAEAAARRLLGGGQT